MKKIVMMGTAALLLTLSEGAFAYQIKVGEGVQKESLSKSDLKKIYLGRKTKLSDGTAVIPVALRKGETHEEFLSEIVNKTPSQFRIYWKRAIFTGKNNAIKIFSSEDEARDFIESTPGAIGYFSDGGLSVVDLQEASPKEKIK